MIYNYVPNRNQGIYQIKNIITNKVYIGSSINLKRRFKVHIIELASNRHHSPHLQNAWNKYGRKSFTFNILEYSNDGDDLLQREQYYIDYYQSYEYINGYNVCKFAGTHLDVCKYGTIFLKRVVDSTVFQSTSIRSFANQHNIPENAVRQLVRGVAKYRSGFCLPNTELPRRILIDPYNNEHKIYNLKEFCYFYGYTSIYKSLGRVLRHGTNEFNGWHLKGNDIRKPLYSLKNKMGEIITFRNIDKFARDNSLINTTVRNILIRKTKEFEGWSLA